MLRNDPAPGFFDAANPPFRSGCRKRMRRRTGVVSSLIGQGRSVFYRLSYEVEALLRLFGEAG